MTSRRSVAAGALVLLAATGCGGPTIAPAGSVSATAASVPVALAAKPLGSFAAADTQFIASMLPHHAYAETLAAFARKHSSDPRVQQFAAAEIAAVQPEITQMTARLADLGIDPSSLTPHTHGGRSVELDMAELSSLTGPAFDARYLDLVLDHSLQAAAIAQQEVQGGFELDMRRLAAAVAARSWADVETARALR